MANVLLVFQFSFLSIGVWAFFSSFIYYGRFDYNPKDEKSRLSANFNLFVAAAAALLTVASNMLLEGLLQK